MKFHLIFLTFIIFLFLSAFPPVLKICPSCEYVKLRALRPQVPHVPQIILCPTYSCTSRVSWRTCSLATYAPCLTCPRALRASCCTCCRTSRTLKFRARENPKSNQKSISLMLYTIWYHLHNFKNVKDIQWGV